MTWMLSVRRQVSIHNVPLEAAPNIDAIVQDFLAKLRDRGVTRIEFVEWSFRGDERTLEIRDATGERL